MPRSPSMRDEDRLAFVESLQLAELSEPGATHLGHLLALADNPRAGFIDDGSLISFVAGVSPQSQRDALNSTLLAQLAANQRYNRENDTPNWYAFYRNVLENVGWVIQDFSFAKLNVSTTSFTMDKAVLDLIATIASGADDIAATQATLDALRSLQGSDGRLALFENESHSASNGNFQIGVASEVGGVLAMRIGAFYFSSTQNITNILWFHFNSSTTNVYKGAQAISLNKQIYNTVRGQIVAKLGDKALRFVKDLDIG